MNQKDQQISSNDPTARTSRPVGLGSQESAGAKGQEFQHQSGWLPGAPGEAPALRQNAESEQLGAVEPGQSATAADQKRIRGSWTIITISCALLLTLLSVAGVILVTRPRAVIDQLLILTVPSGANVDFDGRPLGPSPVKLEGVRMGTHRIVVTKDGYQRVQADESITDSRTLDYKLNLLPPPGAENLPDDQAISQYRQNMEEAFQRGDYAIPYYGRSALYFAQLIIERDSSNAAALEMKDRVRGALVQLAQTAMSRLDLAQAQDVVYVLSSYYPNDEEARAAAQKLEAQIALHRSDVRELVRKAEEALDSGNLIDPPRASAYYYAKQALTLDRQNQRARAVKGQVHDRVLQSIDQTVAAGYATQASRQLEQALRLFPDDPQLQARHKEMEQLQAADVRATDPKERRLRGLESYRLGRYADAVPDLEYAVQHERGSQDVMSALGMCYKKLREFDKALFYLSQVHQASDDSYVSAVAALGEIYAERGNTAGAIENYKKARDLGGSTLYSRSDLEDKIEALNTKQAGRSVNEPTPLSIPVKHQHGGLLHGSCSGTLTVDDSGVRYDSSDHTFAGNLLHANVRVNKADMAVQFAGKIEKFKPDHPGDAEHFRQALSRYQSAQSAPK